MENRRGEWDESVTLISDEIPQGGRDECHHLSLPGGRSGPQEPGSGPGSFMVGVSDP